MMGRSGCWRDRIENILDPVKPNQEGGRRLYYLWKLGEKGMWKVIVPVTMRGEIMLEHHDSKVTGHVGLMKTLEKLKASPFFVARNEEVG